MKFLEKQVSKYGNSKVINVPELEKDITIYVIDKEMLEFIRGVKLNESK